MTEEFDDDALLDVEPAELLSKAMERRKKREFTKSSSAFTEEELKPDIRPEFGAYAEEAAPEAESEPPAQSQEYVPRHVDSEFTDESDKVLKGSRAKDRLPFKASRTVEWLLKRLNRRQFDRDKSTPQVQATWWQADDERRSIILQLGGLSIVIVCVSLFMIPKPHSANSTAQDATSAAIDSVSDDLLKQNITLGNAGIAGTAPPIREIPPVVSDPAPATVPDWARMKKRAKRNDDEAEFREQQAKDEQVDQLQRLIASSASDSARRLELARLLIELHRFREAIEHYQVLMKTTALSDQDKLAFANALAACRQNELATTLYQSLLNKPGFETQARDGLNAIETGQAPLQYKRAAPIRDDKSSSEDSD